MSALVLDMGIGDCADHLDRDVMKDLRDTVGQVVFNELIEDVIFEVTERIARIERLNQTGDMAAIANIAHDLVAISGQIGMCCVSEIASGLERCCQDQALVSTKAIAQRLVRVGEASVVAATEMSIDLSPSSNGRRVI